MKRSSVVLVVLIAILAMTSGLYAYWRYIVQPSKPSSTPYAVAVSPPLELRLELDKTQFQVNETVIIRVSLKNTGNQTITVEFPYMDAQLGFNVKDSNDKSIFVKNRGYLPAFAYKDLEPGALISETFEWSQERENLEVWPPSLDPVDLGTYKIIGRAGSYDHPILETPPIIIDNRIDMQDLTVISINRAKADS